MTSGNSDPANTAPTHLGRAPLPSDSVDTDEALVLGRVPYVPIPERPVLRWPEGRRVAVWVVPNIEHYEYLPGPNPHSDPWPRAPHPDVLGYGLRDYGNRVGLWRMFDVMDRNDLRCTVSLNLAAFEHYPEIMGACEARRWDYMCHGIYNTRYHWGMSEEEEASEIAECVATFRKLVGRDLPGWFSPALTPTLRTPDLVAEAGIKYHCDWAHDDQPFPFRVRSGRLISVPYSLDLNDAVWYRQGHDAEEFLRMVKDTFDTLYEEGERTGRVMCIAVHPYIMGHPHRIAYLDEALRYVRGRQEVWMATGEEIADWYYATMWDAVAGYLEGDG